MKTPARQIASAMGMYYGGMSLDAIQQQFRQDYDLDMSESNKIQSRGLCEISFD
jgi:hypothetical protein